jgi:micrococcal nuclease
MKSRRFLIFLLIVCILALFSIYYPAITGNITKQDYYPRESAILLRAVDGDTIEAKVGEEIWKIRVLGINTPEKNMPAYQEAKDFLKSFENRSIELQRDGPDSDLYKRKLRYIFYDNRFLDLEIIQNGLANAYYTDGLKYEKDFLDAEKKARAAEVGIWKRSQETCANCILLDKLDPINESFTLNNICNFECNLDGWFVKDAGRNTFNLDNIIGDSKKTYFSKKDVWNNNGDKFFMYDPEGLLVIYYEY